MDWTARRRPRPNHGRASAVRHLASPGLARARLPSAIALAVLLGIVVAVGCTAENLGCVSRMASRRARIQAYRFDEPPEVLLSESTRLLEARGFHVPSAGSPATRVVSSWRYAEGYPGPTRTRVTVELTPEGEGSSVQALVEQQELSGVRWEAVGTERFEEAERALTERLTGRGVAPGAAGQDAEALAAGPEETEILQALSAVLDERGEVLIGGLGERSPEGWRFRTSPRTSGQDERRSCTGRLAVGPSGAMDVEISRVRERAVDVRPRAAPTRFRDEDMELDLIRRVDRAAAEAIETGADRVGDEVTERAYWLGFPSCSGGCM